MQPSRNTQAVYAAHVGVGEITIIALDSKKRIFPAFVNKKALFGGQFHALSSTHAERLA